MFDADELEDYGFSEEDMKTSEGCNRFCEEVCVLEACDGHPECIAWIRLDEAYAREAAARIAADEKEARENRPLSEREFFATPF